MVKGVTLLEFVLVLVIVGILAVYAAPVFMNKQDYEKQFFFDEILNAIRQAQKLAIASSCNVIVSIQNNNYQVLQPQDRTKCSSTSTTDYQLAIHPGTQQAFTGSSQSGVSLVIESPALTAFVFNALGQSVSASSIVVTIGGSKKITVVGETGFVYDSTP